MCKYSVRSPSDKRTLYPLSRANLGTSVRTSSIERAGREVQAELDAGAFHAYGLDRDQTEFVLDDFHRVQSSRIMDEDYLEMVLEKYDALA